MEAEAGGLPLSTPGLPAGAVNPLAPLGPGPGLGRAPGRQGSGYSNKTTWIVVGCCSAGALVLLLIGIVLTASLGSRRPSPPPVAGTPPQGVSASNVPAQPAPVPPQPPARPVWEPDPQLAATLGQEITFHGVALRLPQGMEELQNLPPMHPHPKVEQKAYRAIFPGDMKPSVIVVEYIPSMMAGAGRISISAVQQELRTAFVYGLQASDVQSEIGMVGGAEVVRFRFRGTLNGVEYWQQVLGLPLEDGVLLLAGVTGSPPDSASYNLLGCSLLTLRRI